MGIGLLLPMPHPVGQSPAPHAPSHTIRKVEFECTCGARAFEEERQRKLSKRVAPMGVAGVMLLHAADVEKELDDEMPTRKRSLWRKLLGKGPKCICEQRCVKVLELPSEYTGCTKVLVAGKRVPFTREMQRIKRLAYKPMDAIDEGEDDA